MSSYTTQLICNKFGGIKKKDAVFSSDIITASDLQNVELFYTGLNSGIGIRTVLGNISVTNLIPSDEKIIDAFEATQQAVKYDFIYTESNIKGRIYLYNIAADTLTLLADNLTPTGNCCFSDFAQGWSDYTIFTNGTNFYHFEMNAQNVSDRIVNWNTQGYLIGTENETISGLGLVTFNGRLWIFNKQRLWYSATGVCYDFHTNSADISTSAGYIEFSKNITAIHEYLGALAVFHSDSSVLLKVDSNSNFSKEEESPGGCASYNSLVFHNTDLFFYDDTKKGVFSFQQVISGEKTLGTNIAYDIQEILNNINQADLNKIRTLSVFTEDRNEVWFLLPVASSDDNHSVILIYDYLRNAWIKRKCQKINGFRILKNKLYSFGSSLFEEYIGDDFNGEFIESFYSAAPLNLGVDNTFKITKFPPRLTIDAARTNDFWVEYIRNYNILKNPKIKRIQVKTLKNILTYDVDYYDTDFIYIPKTINSICKMSSSTFKTIQIKFYTTLQQQGFCITNIEFSKIKVKQV